MKYNIGDFWAYFHSEGNREKYLIVEKAWNKQRNEYDYGLYHNKIIVRPIGHKTLERCGETIKNIKGSNNHVYDTI